MKTMDGFSRQLAVALALVACRAPAVDFNIVDYGAKDDGSACTESVAHAVKAAADKGGRVVIPAGTWNTGCVRLASNVELHLEKGAVLVFSDRVTDYLPGVPVSWEGIECVNVSPLVYAYGCTNVAISGSGEFRAKMDFWRNWQGRRKPACEAVCQRLRDEWAGGGRPVEERRICDEAGAEFRPQFFHFNRCRNVALSGFKVRGTPFWTLHFFLCDGVDVRMLDVSAFVDGEAVNNSDGIDVECSRNVVVADCVFDQGDDAIVIKSGRDQDGWRLRTPTENVVVRNCVVKRGHVLLGVGSEVGGGIRNVVMEDCRVEGAVRRLLFVKTSPRRGGFVEDVTMRNIVAGEVLHDVVSVDTRYYYGGQNGEPEVSDPHLTPIRGLTVENVRCASAGRRIMIAGDPDMPIRRVAIRDVVVEGGARMPDRVAHVVDSGGGLGR